MDFRHAGGLLASTMALSCSSSHTVAEFMHGLQSQDPSGEGDVKVEDAEP